MPAQGKPKIVIELDNVIVNFTGDGLIIIKKHFNVGEDISSAIELNEQEASEFAQAFGMGIAAVHTGYGHMVQPQITFQFPGEDEDN